MRLARVRFTIGSMMVATSIVGLFSWIITGLNRDGTAWFRNPPLYLVLAYPFLFAAGVTFAVTLVQFRSERRLGGEDRTGAKTPRRSPWRIR
jgi:hypothetical protein